MFLYFKVADGQTNAISSQALCVYAYGITDRLLTNRHDVPLANWRQQETNVRKKNIGDNVIKNVYRNYVLHKFFCGHCRSKVRRKPGFAAVAVHVVAVVDAFALGRTLQSIFRFHLHFDLHAFCLMS